MPLISCIWEFFLLLSNQVCFLSPAFGKFTKPSFQDLEHIFLATLSHIFKCLWMRHQSQSSFWCVWLSVITTPQSTLNNNGYKVHTNQHFHSRVCNLKTVKIFLMKYREQLFLLNAQSLKIGWKKWNPRSFFPLWTGCMWLIFILVVAFVSACGTFQSSGQFTLETDSAKLGKKEHKQKNINLNINLKLCHCNIYFNSNYNQANSISEQLIWIKSIKIQYKNIHIYFNNMLMYKFIWHENALDAYILHVGLPFELDYLCETQIKTNLTVYVVNKGENPRRKIPFIKSKQNKTLRK